MAEYPSRSAVKKAGSAIRKFARGEMDVSNYLHHLELIDAYRATFLEPMKEFRALLVDLLEVAQIPAETTWRLKRLPTIIDKLTREPTLNLALMQDIGGCRSVVTNFDDLYKMKNLVQQYWECKVSDYVADPRPSGYRALHLAADTGNGKIVELQIRTPTMHKWAETVEAFSGIFGENYKQDGEHIVQQFTEALSKTMQAEELGTLPDKEAADRLNQLIPVIQSMLKERQATVERRNYEHD